MNMNKIKVLAIALLATVISAVGLATFAAPVSANNGPHGGYTLTTAACAGCHRAHTAAGTDLLKETNVYALCISCHNGDFATTDVQHGRRTGDSAPLNGGGFELANAKAVTSSHTVEGLGGSSGLGTAWGGASSGQGVSGTLECVSCHNPHGTTNYRILRDSANGYPSGPANAALHKWVPSDPNLLNWVDTQVVATVHRVGLPGTRLQVQYELHVRYHVRPGHPRHDRGHDQGYERVLRNVPQVVPDEERLREPPID